LLAIAVCFLTEDRQDRPARVWDKGEIAFFHEEKGGESYGKRPIVGRMRSFVGRELSPNRRKPSSLRRTSSPLRRKVSPHGRKRPEMRRMRSPVFRTRPG